MTNRWDINNYGWYEWLCHTNFSFLIGASHPSEFVTRAAELGYKGFGVTDFDGVYGLARTHTKWRSIKDHLEPKLKLFYGSEIHLRQDHDLPVILQDTLALVAQSHQGYRNLCKLCTYAHRGGKTKAHVPLSDMLQQSVDDLIAFQPMRGSQRHTGFDKQFQDRCTSLRDHFGGRFYFVISRHLNPSEDFWIEPTIQLAKRLGAGCILSQDPFFHAAHQKDMSDLMHALRHNLTLDKAVPHMFVNSERCLHTLAGIARRYHSLSIYKEALQTSAELAESCQFSFEDLNYQYPKEMIPEHHTAQSFLEKIVWDEARKRYNGLPPEKVANLLTKELTLIKRLKFADYFLTVWDIVRWAQDQKILYQGRGSAANSAVCFVLGITAVNPDTFDILFERFISVERGDPPDIDVDFEHERREEVIQYIYDRYGRNRASMVANVITFRRKGSLRAVGKSLGIPEKVLGAVSKRLETRYFRGNEAHKVLRHTHQHFKNSSDMSEPCSSSEEGCEFNISNIKQETWELWGDLAERLKGFPRHLGIHSGGFMLADKPLDWLVPQEPATMEGRTVVQWCKDDIEDLGFFKIDILALGMLTALRKGFALINKTYDQNLNYDSIPADDANTYRMIQRADTVGTFQIESRAQMSMLPRLRPKTFYDLVIEIAIIRPGPIQGGMIHPFLKRREGLEPITFPDERLRPILKRTLGIPIFQEQVMRIAMAVGDFTPGEANELRRNMGVWSMKGDLAPVLSKLARGMRKNGLEEKFIKGILNQMKGFSDYGFPESHSVSFAFTAYASCYMKCHYPAAFFASVLNSQPMGFYSPHALLQAAQREGVKVLPVCVNNSDWDNTLENIAPPEHPPDYAIRLGLRLVNSLRKPGALDLLDTRKSAGGNWGDLEHFLQTVRLYRSDLTALAAANALSTFNVPRRAAIWLAEAAPFCPILEEVEDPIQWPQETIMERIERDFATTSTSIGIHPTKVIRTQHWCYRIPVQRLVLSKEINTRSDGQMIDAFAMILVRQAPPSANGMVFLTLEDETGFINLAFTPSVYNRYYQLVESQAFLCVHAKVQRQNESHSLLVKHVYAPELQRAEVVDINKTQLQQSADSENSSTVTGRTLQRSRNYM